MVQVSEQCMDRQIIPSDRHRSEHGCARLPPNGSRFSRAHKTFNYSLPQSAKDFLNKKRAGGVGCNIPYPAGIPSPKKPGTVALALLSAILRSASSHKLKTVKRFGASEPVLQLGSRSG